MRKQIAYGGIEFQAYVDIRKKEDELKIKLMNHLIESGFAELKLTENVGKSRLELIIFNESLDVFTL